MVYYIDEEEKVRDIFTKRLISRNESSWVKFSVSLNKAASVSNKNKELIKMITEEIINHRN